MTSSAHITNDNRTSAL